MKRLALPLALPLGLALSLASTSCLAAGGYAGLTLGQSDIDEPGFDKGTSFSLLGGYRATDNVAFEVGYLDLGEAQDDIDPVFTFEADGLTFSAMGIIPLNETAEIFGKFGIFMWDGSLSVAGFGEVASEDGSDLFLGVGAQFRVAEQVRLGIAYDKYSLDDIDADNLALTARVYF